VIIYQYGTIVFYPPGDDMAIDHKFYAVSLYKEFSDYNIVAGFDEIDLGNKEHIFEWIDSTETVFDNDEDYEAVADLIVKIHQL
jgi:hypothetical protein